jgi:hypothetical protein
MDHIVQQYWNYKKEFLGQIGLLFNINYLSNSKIQFIAVTISGYHDIHYIMTKQYYDNIFSIEVVNVMTDTHSEIKIEHIDKTDNLKIIQLIIPDRLLYNRINFSHQQMSSLYHTHFEKMINTCIFNNIHCYHVSEKMN